MSSRLLELETAAHLLEEKFPECPHRLVDPAWSSKPIRFYEEDAEFETLETGGEILLFAGDLRVQRWIKDRPESLLLVCGNLRAQDILTQGNISVRGDSFVERLLSGCSEQGHSFWGRGDLQASVLLEQDHRWQCQGRLVLYQFSGRLSHVLASSYRISQHIHPSELFLNDVFANKPFEECQQVNERLWSAVRENKPFLKDNSFWT